MQKIIERAMNEWAEKEKEKLGKEFCQMVSDALYDLYYGPGKVAWTSTIKKIRNYVEDYGDMYVDIQSEEVFDQVPEGYSDEDGTWIEPEDYYLVEYKRVLRYLIEDLADYV